MQDCNFVIYGGTYIAGGAPVAASSLYGSSTYGKAVGLCSVAVSGANGGTVTILDSQNNVVFSQPAGTRSSSLNGLAAGQSLAQGDRLYSPNANFYLNVQADGNLVLCASCPLLPGAAVASALPACCSPVCRGAMHDGEAQSLLPVPAWLQALAG